jgi:hypothetical protein
VSRCGAAARRAATVLGTVLVLGSIPAATWAQDTGGAGFVGYAASATGTAVTAFPSVPALLPVDVPVEATLSLATATLSSGGQGFGRASTFFPGTLLAGLRPLIETAAGARLPIPDYPIVVEAREFEEAKRSDIPGVTMTADVDPNRAVAVADVGALGLQAIMGVRSIHTESRTVVEGSRITATSTSTLNGIDIAGVLTIGALVSESSVTSDGTTSECSGRLEITGAAVAGTPVAIDDEGLHVEGQGALPGLGLGRLVETTLRGAGLEARALGGDDACEGPFGSRTTAGLFVSLPLGAIGSIPAGGGLRLVLGSTAASAGGSSLPAEEPLPPDTPPVLGDVVTRLPGPLTGGGALPPAALAPRTSSDSGGLELPVETVAYDFDGVPVGLLVGLALLAVVASGRIRRYMDHIIGMVSGP